MSVMSRGRSTLDPRSAIALVSGIVGALAFTQGCGSGGSTTAADAGTLGVGGAETATGTGGDDSPGDPGGTTDPGTAGDDATAVPGNDAGLVSNAPDFEGIDIASMPEVATPGCAGGFDVATGTLTLAVEATTRSLFIDATDGAVRANAIVCSKGDGTAVAPADLNALVVQGTAGDDDVVFDLLPGDFGALLGRDGAIRMDLGGGADVIRIRATLGDDHLGCAGAEAGPSSVVDFGTGARALLMDNVESLVVSLGPGNDSFAGSGSVPCAVPLVIYGGAGNDVLSGGAGDDTLNGGDDDDNFDMGAAAAGADIVNGGAGEDFISYAKRTRGVTIELCPSASNSGCEASTCACQPTGGEPDEHDIIVNVESAEGGEGDDAIRGDANANALIGNGGNDRIEGLAGDDQIFGNAGDDALYGGDGDDILVGGEGSDTFDGQGGNNICLYDSKDSARDNCNTAVETD